MYSVLNTSNEMNSGLTLPLLSLRVNECNLFRSRVLTQCQCWKCVRVWVDWLFYGFDIVYYYRYCIVYAKRRYTFIGQSKLFIEYCGFIVLFALNNNNNCRILFVQSADHWNIFINLTSKRSGAWNADLNASINGRKCQHIQYSQNSQNFQVVLSGCLFGFHESQRIIFVSNFHFQMDWKPMSQNRDEFLFIQTNMTTFCTNKCTIYLFCSIIRK